MRLHSLIIQFMIMMLLISACGGEEIATPTFPLVAEPTGMPPMLPTTFSEPTAAPAPIGIPSPAASANPTPPESPVTSEPTAAATSTTHPTIGDLLWLFKPGSAREAPFWVSPLTSPTVNNGVIYVGASDVPGGKKGSLQALDASDGTLLWSYDHDGHTPSTPLVAEGVVYFGSEDHNVYAADASTAANLWNYTTDGLSFISRGE